MQKIIDEISSDASLYSAMGNDCGCMIPFIWDDSARSQEHDYLRQGLKKLPKIIDAVASLPVLVTGIGNRSRCNRRKKQKGRPRKATSDGLRVTTCRIPPAMYSTFTLRISTARSLSASFLPTTGAAEKWRSLEWYGQTGSDLGRDIWGFV